MACRPKAYSIVTQVRMRVGLRTFESHCWQLGGPELAIVNAIAHNPALVQLVDEIFFEYHFWFDGMRFGWGKVDKKSQGTVDDALRLMHELRQVGVRSHFWI